MILIGGDTYFCDPLTELAGDNRYAVYTHVYRIWYKHLLKSQHETGRSREAMHATLVAVVSRWAVFLNLYLSFFLPIFYCFISLTR